MSAHDLETLIGMGAATLGALLLIIGLLAVLFGKVGKP